jgi:hypothetical protein
MYQMYQMQYDKINHCVALLVLFNLLENVNETDLRSILQWFSKSGSIISLKQKSKQQKHSDISVYL